MNLKQFWKNYKEGLIIGAISGYIVGRFFLPTDFDFSVIAQTSSIIDVLQGAGTTALEFAKTKVILTFTIIGAVLGTIVDIIWTGK